MEKSSEIDYNGKTSQVQSQSCVAQNHMNFFCHRYINKLINMKTTTCIVIFYLLTSDETSFMFSTNEKKKRFKSTANSHIKENIKHFCQNIIIYRTNKHVLFKIMN